MSKIIYQLITEDVQNVAEQEIGRKLTPRELDLVQKLVERKISWYEIIAESIDELKVNA
jgi:hypothetical protein